jgi:hypothetical protein
MAIKVYKPEEMAMKYMPTEDRFDIKMYSNLCVPSFMHAYSMGVEYARDWFLEKMPAGFFKTDGLVDNVHINEKNVFDDYRRLSRNERLKRKKPFLIITPQLNYDFDMETVQQYNYGPEILARMGWQQDSFFRDSTSGQYIVMNLQLVEMQCSYKVTVYTRAQQLDLFKKMELWFRIGATETQNRDMDFHIPEDIISNLAVNAGFELDSDMSVKDPIAFTRYMNQHSAFPILYKFRNVTHRYEFFIRIKMLAVHTFLSDKLRPDEGETQGQLRTNYSIEMSATFRYVAPQFYAYYHKDPPKYEIPKNEPLTKDSALIDIGTFKIVDIPLHNERGWEKFIWSKYDYDEDDIGIIDLTEMIGDASNEDNEFYRVIEKCKATGLSPSIYADIKLYSSDPYTKNILDTSIDWKELKIYINDDIAPQILYITIYVDLGYYNAALIEEDDMTHNRIVRHKAEEEKVNMNDIP